MKCIHLCSLLLLCIVACTTSKPGPPAAGLYTAPQEWATALHDGFFTAKTYSIGAYKTGSRQNGVAKPGLPVSIKNPRDAFYYTLSGPNATLAVQTLNTLHVVFSDRSLPAYLNSAVADAPFFYSLLGDAAQTATRWELILKQPTYLDLNNDNPVGILMLDKTTYRITAHNHFGIINSYEHVVYEIQDHGKPVAAVMPGAQPRVWVSKTVTPQQEILFAGVISALLLRA